MYFLTFLKDNSYWLFQQKNLEGEEYSDHSNPNEQFYQTKMAVMDTPCKLI